MKSPIVVDSTCLIGLERIRQLELLPALFEPVSIPPEVAREFGVSIAWLNVENPSDEALIQSLKPFIDLGEAEAIALAYENAWKILTDDRQARSVARQMGLSLIGTIGVLVLAKQQEMIPAVKPLLQDLEANNFFMSSNLKAEALRLANE